MSETTVQPYTQLFEDFNSGIRDGTLLIPQFQRDFVWNMKNSAELIDSIIKGYPIGTFIFWHTKERLHHFRRIGDQALPSPEEGSFVDFVLDGQQRLKCMYACFKGAKVLCKGNRQPGDFGKICVDLDARDNAQIVRADIANPEGSNRYVPVKYIFDFPRFTEKTPKERRDEIMAYSKKIADYKYSVVRMSRARLDVATEAFTRINTKGRQLKTFEIMVAKTYDENRFDLAEEWGKLHASLKERSYGTVDSETVLRTVALIADRNCTKAHILNNMDKEKFIKNWGKAVDAIKRAVDYFHACRIPSSSVLPYNALVASYAYFFSRATQPPSNTQKELLEDFFWRVALTNRYRDSVESNLAKDITHMDSFLEGKKADYDPADWKVSVQPQDIIDNGSFKGNVYGSAYCKAILCLYFSHRPQSFNNGNDVALNDKWLSKGNSKNYHHFFPKAFLNNQEPQVPQNKIDHILNITIVDEALNLRIGARSPSLYMEGFKRENLTETMKTHLITDLGAFGVLDNNYGKFFKERAKAVSKELSDKIIPISANSGQDADEKEE